MRVSVVKESLTTPLILALLLTLAGCASANKPRTYTVVEFGVWGAMEQKTGLRTIVGRVSEGPELASGD